MKLLLNTQFLLLGSLTSALRAQVSMTQIQNIEPLFQLWESEKKTLSS